MSLISIADPKFLHNFVRLEQRKRNPRRQRRKSSNRVFKLGASPRHSSSRANAAQRHRSHLRNDVTRRRKRMVFWKSRKRKTRPLQFSRGELLHHRVTFDE